MSVVRRARTSAGSESSCSSARSVSYANREYGRATGRGNSRGGGLQQREERFVRERHLRALQERAERGLVAPAAEVRKQRHAAHKVAQDAVLARELAEGRRENVRREVAPADRAVVAKVREVEEQVAPLYGVRDETCPLSTG